MADRQNRVAGFSTDAVRKKTAAGVGAGGLSAGFLPLLVRKGVGKLVICDDDLVELSNLNRQAFYREDLYKPKAFRLAKNAAREGFLGTTCIGHYVAFGPESAELLSEGIDVAIVAVDNDSTRAFASQFFRKRKIPVIFTAVNRRANYGYVFVDHYDGPCLGCVFPQVASARGPRPCEPSPAVIDILRLVGAIVSYAFDSLVMDRPRGWNLKVIDLVSCVGDETRKVDREPGCPLCGGKA